MRATVPEPRKATVSKNAGLFRFLHRAQFGLMPATGVQLYGTLSCCRDGCPANIFMFYFHGYAICLFGDGCLWACWACGILGIVGIPSEANRITSHFRATFCGVLPARASDCSTCF